MAMAGTGDNDPGASVIISDTHTFGPSVVNELKLGYASQSFDYWGVNNVNERSRIDRTAGISAAGNDPANSSMPAVDIAGANGFQGTTSTGYQLSNSEHLSNNR